MFAPRFDPSEGLSSHGNDQEGSNFINKNGDEIANEVASSSDEMSGENSTEEEEEEEKDRKVSASQEPASSVDDSTNDSSESSEESSSSEENYEDMKDSEMKDMDENEYSNMEAIDEAASSTAKTQVSSEEDSKYVSKHESIFSKYRSSLPQKRRQSNENDAESEDEEDVEKQDLKPLPQPEIPRDKILDNSKTQINGLDWLGEPIYSSPENTKPFNQFSLSPFILHNLAKMNYNRAFSVQVTVLDVLLKDISVNKLLPDHRGDLLVNAATGSGKTLAYSLPILEALHDRVVPRIRAIVLVPTKPLITQVKSTMTALAKGTNLLILSLRSDVSVKEEARRITENVPDIIISTPGRIVDHILDDSINLKDLRFLVIDEADRLLNQSFQNWCQILISKLESEIDISKRWKLPPQKLIFSATLSTNAGKLSLLKFHRPRIVIVNDRNELVNELFNVPPTLNENILSFSASKSSLKPLILAKFLMSSDKLSNVLVFTKSNEASLRLSRLLQMLFDHLISDGALSVTYINSTNNTASSRSKILSGFSNQKINILVATDLIARGIDILSITDVINYDIPNSSREYVHRVGRTARANQAGFAYSLCIGNGEKKWFTKLMGDIGRGDKEVNQFDFELQQHINEKDEAIYKDCLGKLQDQVFARPR